jgi:hypothetical protein
MLHSTISVIREKGISCWLKGSSLLYSRFHMRATDTTPNTIRVPAAAAAAAAAADGPQSLPPQILHVHARILKGSI